MLDTFVGYVHGISESFPVDGAVVLSREIPSGVYTPRDTFVEPFEAYPLYGNPTDHVTPSIGDVALCANIEIPLTGNTRIVWLGFLTSSKWDDLDYAHISRCFSDKHGNRIIFNGETDEIVVDQIGLNFSGLKVENDLGSQETLAPSAHINRLRMLPGVIRLCQFKRTVSPDSDDAALENDTDEDNNFSHKLILSTNPFAADAEKVDCGIHYEQKTGAKARLNHVVDEDGKESDTFEIVLQNGTSILLNTTTDADNSDAGVNSLKLELCNADASKKIKLTLDMQTDAINAQLLMPSEAVIRVDDTADAEFILISDKAGSTFLMDTAAKINKLVDPDGYGITMDAESKEYLIEDPNGCKIKSSSTGWDFNDGKAVIKK